MSDSPQAPRTPNQRPNKEFEDPHYHDEEETAPVEDDEQHRSHPGNAAPRRKPLYRPRRRFVDD